MKDKYEKKNISLRYHRHSLAAGHSTHDLSHWTGAFLAVFHQCHLIPFNISISISIIKKSLKNKWKNSTIDNLLELEDRYHFDCYNIINYNYNADSNVSEWVSRVPAWSADHAGSGNDTQPPPASLRSKIVKQKWKKKKKFQQFGKKNSRFQKFIKN